jgi:hypothetical protein
MTLYRLRRRCERLIAALDLPTPLDLAALCCHLGARRGRRVRLVPIPLPAGGASGYWLATEKADYIVTDCATVGPHQLHIILHELAHMILGHGGSIVEASASQQVWPEADPGPGHRLNRTHYDLAEECEAEMLASLLQKRMGQWRPAEAPTVPPEAAHLVARISRTMEHRPTATAAAARG